MPKITIEVSDTVYKLLQVLDPERSPSAVLLTLADHAQQGVYRPGSWERDWIVSAFGQEWIENLEPGDPYGRPNSPMFQRPQTMTDRDLADRLGEAIRRVLTWEHLPNCDCDRNLRNHCRQKILSEAWELYCREHPHVHGDIF